MKDEIIVTNWEEVEENDFYLSDEWMKNEDEEAIKKARELQKAGDLYIAYAVTAVNYAIYREMDATQLFIDSDGNEIMYCESEIIKSDHREAWERNL